MYKLFINDFSCSEIGNVYGKNERAIQYPILVNNDIYTYKFGIEVNGKFVHLNK